jgi:hypothetical protein
MTTSWIGSVRASSSPQTETIPDSRRGHVNGGGAIGNGGEGVLIEGAQPSFLPIDRTPIFNNYTLANESQQLDGFDCRGCTFRDVELTYSGGAYHIENARFSGTTRLVLTGAAANTLAFLQFMQGIASGLPGVPPLPNKPVERRATAKKPMTGMDITAPFIGAK